MEIQKKTLVILFGILIQPCIVQCKEEAKPQTTVTSTSQEEEEVPEDKKRFKFVIAKSGLKLREDFTTESKDLGLIPFDTKVELLNKTPFGEEVIKGKSTWFHIQHNGIKGWGYGEFLSDFPDFPIFRESFTTVDFSAMYNNGLNRAKLQLHSDNKVTGIDYEDNGCDYTLESGKWTTNQSEKYIKMTTKGYVDCRGRKNISQVYVLKLKRTFDGSLSWTCETGEFDNEKAVICTMD
ncbi:SH3 domain-containing protein [Leptospira levettii]|uniref:SH3 domain-containing protein n=1 Tax=Leptospira levettii TaxID=2023178 RepID=UPI00223CEA67|nr:SH3 domain-containing protein [Leptospira levettii]MCW7494891.1 SH3 domain-containing protein [Leptospira levettii]